MITEPSAYRPEENPRFLPPEEPSDGSEVRERHNALVKLDTVNAVLDTMDTAGWAHFVTTIRAHMLEAQQKALNATDILHVAEARGAARECQWILRLQESQELERDALVEATRVLDEQGEEREHA